MNIKNYFGDYKKNNINQVINYMNELDGSLNKYYNFSKPFFKGDYKLEYKKFLNTRKLNYESLTADKFFEYISPYFKNLPNWNNPGTMINVIPPVNLVALSLSNVVNLYNPNFAQDTYAGMLIASELEVSKYLSELVGWNWQKSFGTFTFGGKGTNLYATKVAINKADKSAKDYGCCQNKYFMLTSQNGHPCHYEVCDWLGIGRANCIEISCNEKGQIDMEKAKNIIEKNIEKGKIFLGFNLTAGSTNELYVDPIKKIYKLNKEIVKKYNLDYTPHIHSDAVLGWVYLFFNDYDFKKNPLNISNSSLSKIKSLNKKIKQLKYSDSIGIDFHKTGFCPYISSLVLFKNKKDYFSLGNDNLDFDKLVYGNYNPYHTTLELTRSSNGPLTALCALKTLGIKGFQEIVSNMFSATEYFRTRLLENSKICLINKDTEWLATLFILKPLKYKNLKLNQIKKLSAVEIEYIRDYNINYGKYILEKAKNNEIDFIFTSSRSYVLPNTSIKIGALKAYPMSVFLNNREVDKIVNEINETIEEYYTIDNNNYNDKIEISDNMVYRR